MSGTHRGDTKTVLIAGDEPKIARVLIDYLDSFGFASHWIDNGDDVVGYVRNDTPDITLLDVMLPGTTA